MDVVDEDGDLFGVVNVVDALVVLVVLAVVTAGAAFVLQPEPEPEEPDLSTTHVTLDLGQQPTYVVSAIDAGDTYSPGGDSRLTITDVHVTPQGGGTRVVVRAELRAPTSGDSVAYGGAPPRLGRSLDVITSRYQVSGEIREVGTDAALTTGTTTVVLRDTMAAADADDVAAGDEVRIAGRTVATIRDVAAYATDHPAERVVFVTATLHTHRQLDQRRFGGNPVRRGQPVTLSPAGYTFDGRIERVGGGLARGTTEVLVEQVVDAETAARLSEGDVAVVAGRETATVERVTVYGTGNPNRKRVSVGLTLRTLTYAERETFGTAVVGRGNTITVDTGDYELSAPIERVGTHEPRGTLTTRTVTLQMSDVPADMADGVRVGMTARAGDTTLVRVTGVDTEPSIIITTGEDGSVHVVDHPINREVTLTTELRVRETTDGVTFKGQRIRQGSTVTIDFGTTVVEATVVAVGA